ncbi:sulfatase-like hydrolase/transferase [Pelagicoccus mobilis]|uniref:Sulfatase-like hydrolase/transferase n=1 Tax=Pelagicoccus mobilis TaxID=415221 RepID=A0A934S175_9BACT|nr:sulfatase-like hydrolase/transferase [Pelagicoccus mobilis]MBK1880472.1 sulfatase-like hydrolase/transferase [Pelagicoccus mobilis]
MTKRKNLIILCPDQMRADALGFMGNEVCRTPNFDRLAERSVVFERHYTTFPKCAPARGTLMTGRYSHSDGMCTVQQTLKPEQPNLCRSLREQGYQTAVFGKNHCWADEDWSRLDFNSWCPELVAIVEPKQLVEEIDFQAEGLTPKRLHRGWDYLGNGTRHRPDEAYTDQSIEFLERLRDPERPFFLQLNWESPHTEYGVEEPWFSMYDREALPALPCSMPSNAPLSVRAQRRHRTGLEDNPKAAKEVQATYYGMISKVDALCGKIMDTIERNGLWKDTVVLFLSDHGDYAGQYGLPEKFDTHFPDCLMQVPLTISDPDLPSGKKVSSLCDLASVAPTLCDLLGIEMLPNVHGESLLPVIAGEREIEAVFADGGHERGMREQYKAFTTPESAPEPLERSKTAVYYHEPESMARSQMVRTELHKLVVRETGDNEFYDLEKDPFEMNNLWGSPEIQKHLPRLYEQLMRWNLKTLPESPPLDWFTV